MSFTFSSLQKKIPWDGNVSFPGSTPFGSANSGAKENNKPYNESQLVIALKKEVSDLTGRFFEARSSRDSALRKNVQMQEDHLLSLKQMQDVIDTVQWDNTALREWDVGTVARLKDLGHEVEKIRCEKTDLRLRIDNIAKESLAKDEKINELTQTINKLETSLRQLENQKTDLLDSATEQVQREREYDDDSEMKEIVSQQPSCSTNSNKQSPTVHKRKLKIFDRKNTTCEKCGVMFSSKRKLLDHGKLPCSKIIFKCSVTGCESKFSNNRQRWDHERNQHSGPVMCKKCNEIFENRGICIMHEQRVHGTPSRVQCQLCSLFFAKNKFRAHQIHCAKKKNGTTKVQYTKAQRDKFQQEIHSLIENKEDVDSKFQGYVPESVLYFDSQGKVGFRPLEATDEQHHIYYTPYTEFKKGQPRGHFAISSNLSPYTWLLLQLERSRDVRDKDERSPSCAHTTKATLAGLKSDWKSIVLVMTATRNDLMDKLKVFSNSICKSSNLYGSTEGLYDPEFWQTTKAQERVISILTSKQIPLR